MVVVGITIISWYQDGVARYCVRSVVRVMGEMQLAASRVAWLWKSSSSTHCVIASSHCLASRAVRGPPFSDNFLLPPVMAVAACTPRALPHQHPRGAAVVLASHL